MIQFAIIDDDLNARTNIQTLLDSHMNEIEYKDYSVKQFNNALAFLEDSKTKYDIVYLDILMPYMDGFELANKIRETNEKMIIIFTTNLTNYAIKGYSVNAYDYLVKPINKAHFDRTLTKALNSIKSDEVKYITLKNKTNIKIVPDNSITYIEIHSHNIIYHFVDQSTFDVWGTLKEEMTKLDEKEYVKINSSQIVNMRHIVQLNNFEIKLTTTPTLYISRSYKTESTKKILDYFGDKA